MDVMPTDPEGLERLALGSLTPVPIEDRSLPPRARLELVKDLLSAGQLPKCTRQGRAPAFFYPGLTSRPTYPEAGFPWAAAVRSRVPDFLADLARLEQAGRRRRFFHTVWPEFTTSGEWAALWLRLYGESHEAAAGLCRRTLAGVDRVPRCSGWLGFSALAPGTHVAPHCGVTNAKLRCHVPLELAPGGSRIRVGEVFHRWRMHELFVFDDSFEHEVWNESDARRVVLIFDIFHPELTSEEIGFLSELERRTVRRTYNDLMRKYRARSKEVTWMSGGPAGRL